MGRALARTGGRSSCAERTQGPTTRRGFLVLDPQSLQVRKRISLRGQFAFDALAPDARTLYLVEYVTVTGRRATGCAPTTWQRDGSTGG